MENTNTQEFVLTNDNYYSPEANKIYMSNSLFKAVYGHPGYPKTCEAAALLGEKIETDALFIGSYVDAYFEGPDSFEEFKENNRSKIMQKSGKQPFKFILDADLAIARVSQDQTFMKYMSGDHQSIMTGEIAGHKFKIKMDSYHPDEMIVDLKYVKSAATDYNENLKKNATFIESYGYFIQGAIYQEIVYQNTGKRLPFYIAYITKENITDYGVVQIPQEKLDQALEYVTINLVAKPFNLIKANPKACGRRSCPYCRDKKMLTGAISYDDFEKYAQT